MPPMRACSAIPIRSRSRPRALDLLEALVEAARLSSRTSNALAEMLSEIESVGATS